MQAEGALKLSGWLVLCAAAGSREQGMPEPPVQQPTFPGDCHAKLFASQALQVSRQTVQFCHLVANLRMCNKALHWIHC